MKNVGKVNNDFVHLYLAFRRKKENPDLTQLTIRKICYDHNDLAILDAHINRYPGVWRIHKTVNKRSCAKAAKLLMHKLFDEPLLGLRMESLWKTCLLQPEARAERNFLLDFDGDNCKSLEEFLIKNGLYTGECGTRVFTPNGAHFITKPFDHRLLEDFKDVTILKDGYIFVGLHKKESLNEKS